MVFETRYGLCYEAIDIQMYEKSNAHEIGGVGDAVVAYARC